MHSMIPTKIKTIDYVKHQQLVTLGMYALGGCVLLFLWICYRLMAWGNGMDLPWGALSIVAGSFFASVMIGVLGYLVTVGLTMNMFYAASLFLTDRILLLFRYARPYVLNDDTEHFWCHNEIRDNAEFSLWLSDIVSERPKNIVLWSDVYFWKASKKNKSKGQSLRTISGKIL